MTPKPARVAELIRTEVPDARRLLDVGCGTGEHAVRFHRDDGFDVSGLEIEPAFIERAQAKLPTSKLYRADMADFDLAVQFDARRN